MSSELEVKEKIDSEMSIQISEKIECVKCGKAKVIIDDHDSRDNEYEQRCICEVDSECSTSKFSTDEFHDIQIQSELTEIEDCGVELPCDKNKLNVGMPTRRNEESEPDIGLPLLMKEENEGDELLSKELKTGEYSLSQLIINEKDELSVDFSSNSKDKEYSSTKLSSAQNVDCEPNVMLPVWMNDVTESGIKLFGEQKEEGEQNIGFPPEKRKKILSDKKNDEPDLGLCSGVNENEINDILPSNKSNSDEPNVELPSVESSKCKPSKGLPFWLSKKAGTEDKSEEGEQNIGLPPKVYKKHLFGIKRAPSMQAKNKVYVKLPPKQDCDNSRAKQVLENEVKSGSNSSSGSTSSSTSRISVSKITKTCTFPPCGFNLVEPLFRIQHSRDTIHRINDTHSTTDTNVADEMRSIGVQTDPPAENPVIYFCRDLYASLTQFLINFSDQLSVEVDSCYQTICFFIGCAAMILMTLIFLIRRAIDTR